MIALEACTGETLECPHTDCPDDWHYGIDLPCACTPDCALTEASTPDAAMPVARAEAQPPHPLGAAP